MIGFAGLMLENRGITPTYILVQSQYRCNRPNGFIPCLNCDAVTFEYALQCSQSLLPAASLTNTLKSLINRNRHCLLILQHKIISSKLRNMSTCHFHNKRQLSSLHSSYVYGPHFILSLNNRNYCSNHKEKKIPVFLIASVHYLQCCFLKLTDCNLILPSCVSILVLEQQS